LNELQDLTEEALGVFDRTPEKVVPDVDAAWRDHFEHAPEGVFSWDSCGHGDAPIPSSDSDLESGWTAYWYECEISRDAKGVETVRFYSIDRDGNDDTKAEFSRGPGVPEWDEPTAREFQQEAAQANCIWRLLRYRLYEIDCVRTGEDPLDNVFNFDQLEGDKLATKIREVSSCNLEKEVRDLHASARAYL